jgi:hypothetical protein
MKLEHEADFALLLAVGNAAGGTVERAGLTGQLAVPATTAPDANAGACGEGLQTSESAAPLTESVTSQPLQSHLIPIAELANGGYEALSREAKAGKLRADFDAFLRTRTELVMQTARPLAEGHHLSPTMIYED